MDIIKNITPYIADSAELRKALVIYWEIVEKNKSPTDKSLKDEMFLACNTLRNDLLSQNEYLRARTLRLISRCMHRGII
jgi:coatomer subunit beta